MIDRIETIDEIKPIYREYLKYINQFFEINDHDSWCECALKNLQRYISENERHIYVLKELECIIGFALVNKHFRFNNDGYAVADFYIQKDHERQGYGRQLAEHVFAQFYGNWEVAVSLKNKAAREFWRRVVSTYTAGNFLEKRRSSFSGYGFLFSNA